MGLHIAIFCARLVTCRDEKLFITRTENKGSYIMYVTAYTWDFKGFLTWRQFKYSVVLKYPNKLAKNINTARETKK